FRRDAGGHQRGGVYVELDNRLLIDALWQLALPPDEERHADTAFPGVALAAAQRRVRRAVLREFADWAAVVAEEENQRVAAQARRVNLVQHGADRLVQGQRHGGVGAALFARDRRDPLQAGVGGVHRRVDGVERQV